MGRDSFCFQHHVEADVCAVTVAGKTIIFHQMKDCNIFCSMLLQLNLNLLEIKLLFSLEVVRTLWKTAEITHIYILDFYLRYY